MPIAPKHRQPAGRTQQRPEKSWASRNTPWRKWYFTPQWFAVRGEALIRDLYQCQKCMRIVTGKEAQGDHKIPVSTARSLEEAERLFFDVDNVETKCVACHSRKTAAEDGGFGNRRK